MSAIQTPIIWTDINEPKLTIEVDGAVGGGGGGGAEIGRVLNENGHMPVLICQTFLIRQLIKQLPDFVILRWTAICVIL